jgi:hypothetical protein
VHEDSPEKFTVVDNVPTKKSARTVALDLKTHNIFLAAADLGPPAQGERWPNIKPGSFVILVVGRPNMVAALAGPDNGARSTLRGLGRLGVDIIRRFHLRLLTVGPAGATPQGGLSWAPMGRRLGERVEEQ